MAKVRTPQTRWIAEGLRALSEGGPDAVRVEELARRLGVTKGGFYWHFADRSALLEAMLDAWELEVVDDVIVHVDAGGGDARARLRQLFAAGVAGGAELLRTELAVREWARRDAAVAKRVRQVDNRRMAYMRSLFAAFCPDTQVVEARCLLALTLFAGNHFVAAEHEGASRSDVVAFTLEWLLT